MGSLCRCVQRGRVRVAEEAGVGVWGETSGPGGGGGGAPWGGGGVGVKSPHFGGEGIENEGALVVPYVRGQA